MKIDRPKEWFLRSAEIEGEAEVGAGMPPATVVSQAESNPYHKPAGFHQPIIERSISSLSPKERFELMFRDLPPREDISTLAAIMSDEAEAQLEFKRRVAAPHRHGWWRGSRNPQSVQPLNVPTEARP